MDSRKIAVLIGMMAFACLPGLQAAPLKPVTEAQANAPLERMEQTLAQANALKMTYACTLPGVDAEGNSQPNVFQVTGSAQRPDKICLELRRRGTLVGSIASDGQTLSVYNSRTKQGAQIAAPARYEVPDNPFDDSNSPSRNLTDALLAVFHPNKDDFQEEQALGNINQAIGPFFQFLRGQTAYETATQFAKALATGKGSEPGGSARYFLARAALNGQPALHTEMIYTTVVSVKLGNKTDRSKAATQFDFYYVEKTSLPLRIISSTALSYLMGKPTTLPVYQYDFASLNLTQTSLPPATFTWTPPANAKSMTRL